jgi:hypothetical protein
MERFDAHVGALDGSLQQRPVVLHAVGVDDAISVLLRVVDDPVDVQVGGTVLGSGFVGLGASL